MLIEPRCLVLPRYIASLALLNTWSRSGVSVGNTEKPIEAVRVTGCSLNLERLRERPRDALREILGVVRVVAGHLQSQKLVAALAREELARAEHPAHPIRDFDQQADRRRCGRTRR